MAENLADVSNNRGIVLLGLGRGYDALEAFEKAHANFAAANLTLKQTQALGNIGYAHLQVGNYARGLAAIEQARQNLESVAAQSQRQIFLLDLAEAYLSLNLHQEALSAHREASALLDASGMQHDRARALWGMGTSLMALGQWDEAARVLETAAGLFATAGNAPMRALVLLRQAAMSATRNDHASGLAQAREALATVENQSWPLQQAYAHLQIADLVLPDVAQAQAHLQACADLVSHLDMPGLRYLLNQRQGHLKLVEGNYASAEPLLQAAANEVEQLRANVSEDRMRISFATDKVAAYDDLIRLYMSRNVNGDVARAFATTERAKARALVMLLGKTSAPKPEATPTEPLSKLRAAQAELNATYSELMSSPEGNMRKRSLPELQARAIELEREISRLQLHANALMGVTDDQLSAPMTDEAVRSQLQPDTALVSYYICDETIFAFVVTQQGVRAASNEAGIAAVASVAPLLQKLGAQWERFRAGREFAQRHAAQLEQSTQRVLAALYGALFEPLEPLMQGAQKLIIVPHGLLHQLPFHALFDGAQYLAERFVISYAPSATALAICQQRPLPNSGNALVVGVADELIPAAAVEAESVAQALERVDVLLNEQATLAHCTSAVRAAIRCIWRVTGCFARATPCSRRSNCTMAGCWRWTPYSSICAARWSRSARANPVAARR
ncbi:MAG: CHAT domain-containing protein [Anaerolineae bacterium]|nr:CHAT domain-containing protein [Anaerolineae bacterium]